MLEDFTTTLKLFERLLPAYFSGSSRLYAQNRDMLLYSGRTKLKLAASPETIAELRRTKQIKYEMRLYNYVLDVFYDKVEKYGLLNWLLSLKPPSINHCLVFEHYVLTTVLSPRAENKIEIELWPLKQDQNK